MRYQIYKGSQSAHCCFEATVVDTTKPTMIGDKHYKDAGDDGQFHYEPVCECFDTADAEMICGALNALEGSNVQGQGEDTSAACGRSPAPGG